MSMIRLFCVCGATLLILAVLPGRIQAFEHTVSVPFGGGVTRKGASVIAVAAATTAVCREGAEAIGAWPLVFFAARTPERRLALAVALMERAECGRLLREDSVPPRLEVTVCGWLPMGEEGDVAGASDLLGLRVKEMLAASGRLDFYETLAVRRALLVAEALALAEEAGGFATRWKEAAKAPQSPRLLYLLRALEALELFERCLSLFSGVWADPESVVLDMERATELDGEVYFFWAALGEALFQTGRNRRALEALDRAVELVPDAARPRHSRGLVYLGMNSVALAERDLSAALRLDPENPEYWQSRGVLRMRQGEQAGMCADVLEACRLGLCGAYDNALQNGWCATATPVNTP